jgi:hypothetical protein
MEGKKGTASNTQVAYTHSYELFANVYDRITLLPPTLVLLKMRNSGSFCAKAAVIRFVLVFESLG